MEAIADPPAYERARAAVRYDEVARTLVHALKYGDRLDLAPTMGRWMARAGRELLREADALVPVPLHWRRLWARRFNQSALLAEAIAQRKRRRRSPRRRSSASRRPPSRSACRRPSAPATSRARSACRRADGAAVAGRRAGAGRRRADLRRHRRCLRAGAAAGRRPATSMCWCSRGLSTPCARPYKLAVATRARSSHGPGRNLHHAVLPLLPRRQGAAAARRT